MVSFLRSFDKSLVKMNITKTLKKQNCIFDGLQFKTDLFMELKLALIDTIKNEVVIFL